MDNGTSFRRVDEVVAAVLAHLAIHRPSDKEPDRRKRGDDEAGEAQRERDLAWDKLTGRELAVLRLLARKGGSNKSIARDLGVSPDTVKLRLRSALRKLRLCNRTAAAVWMREMQDRGGHRSDAALADDHAQQPQDESAGPDPKGNVTDRAPTRAGG